MWKITGTCRVVKRVLFDVIKMMNVSVIHDHAVSASKYYRLISILTVFVFVKGTSALIMAQVLKCGEITIIFLIMSPRSSLLLPFSVSWDKISQRRERTHTYVVCYLCSSRRGHQLCCIALSIGSLWLLPVISCTQQVTESREHRTQASS